MKEIKCGGGVKIKVEQDYWYSDCVRMRIRQQEEYDDILTLDRENVRELIKALLDITIKDY